MQLQRDQLRQFQQILPRCNAIGQSRTHPVNRQHDPVSSARLLHKIIGEIKKSRLLLRCQHIIIFREILRHMEIDNGTKGFDQVIRQIEIVQLASMVQSDAGLQAMYNKISGNSGPHNRNSAPRSADHRNL